MGDSGPQFDQVRAALRQQGARARLRLHRIEALAARMAGFDGPVRAVLEERLLQLLRESEAVPEAATVPRPAPVAGNSLVSLVRDLEALRDSRAAQAPASAALPLPGEVLRAEELLQDDAASAPALPALQAARETWARLRMGEHLRHVMAEVPDDAGPMHSTVLVHRAIAVMQQAAPGYLAHFLGYADALAALERISPSPATTPAPRAPRPPRPPSPANASGPGKAPRPRSRGRRRSA